MSTCNPIQATTPVLRRALLLLTLLICLPRAVTAQLAVVRYNAGVLDFGHRFPGAYSTVISPFYCADAPGISMGSPVHVCTPVWKVTGTTSQVVAVTFTLPPSISNGYPVSLVAGGPSTLSLSVWTASYNCTTPSSAGATTINPLVSNNITLVAGVCYVSLGVSSPSVATNQLGGAYGLGAAGTIHVQ
jgi:hypothetical protein